MEVMGKLTAIAEPYSMEGILMKQNRKSMIKLNESLKRKYDINASVGFSGNISKMKYIETKSYTEKIRKLEKKIITEAELILGMYGKGLTSHGIYLKMDENLKGKIYARDVFHVLKRNSYPWIFSFRNSRRIFGLKGWEVNGEKILPKIKKPKLPKKEIRKKETKKKEIKKPIIVLPKKKIKIPKKEKQKEEVKLPVVERYFPTDSKVNNDGDMLMRKRMGIL